MRYAVVVCPACRHAHGVETGAKTVTCRRCDKRHALDGLRVFFRTDDPSVLAAAVGAVEERISDAQAGLLDAREIAAHIATRAPRAPVATPPPVGDPTAATQWAASRATGAQGDQARATKVLLALDEAFPDGFTPTQLEDAFAAAGLPAARAEKEIRRALQRDELYEPRPGILKRLG